MWKIFLCISIILIENGEMVAEFADCDEDKLVSYLANLEVLSPESIFSLSIDDVELMCKKLDENMKPIDQYLKACNKNPDDKDLYTSLIRGVKVLNDKLCCMDSAFYRRFCIFHPCLAELKNDFESCNGPADWNEEQDNEKVCRTYKSIVDCYYIKAAKVCGKDAAKAITELIEDVVNRVIGIKCKGINTMPYVKDIMPDNYIKRNNAEKECSHTFMTTVTAVLFFLHYILPYFMIL